MRVVSPLEDQVPISHEMLMAGLSQTSHDPDYPHVEMVQEVFISMLLVVLESPELRRKYSQLLSG